MVLLRVLCLSENSRGPPVSSLRRSLSLSEQRLRGEHLYPCRGELYGKRQTLQVCANLCDGLGVLGSQREGGVALAGTIDEQPNCLVAFQLCHRGRLSQDRAPRGEKQAK